MTVGLLGGRLSDSPGAGHIPWGRKAPTSRGGREQGLNLPPASLSSLTGSGLAPGVPRTCRPASQEASCLGMGCAKWVWTRACCHQSCSSEPHLVPEGAASCRQRVSSGSFIVAHRPALTQAFPAVGLGRLCVCISAFRYFFARALRFSVDLHLSTNKQNGYVFSSDCAREPS